MSSHEQTKDHLPTSAACLFTTLTNKIS